MPERHARDDGSPRQAFVRVLVAGDAAVGKSSLIAALCGEGPGGGGLDGLGAADGDWTCGCQLSLVRETIEAGGRPLDVEVELREVGGTQMYACARPVFYDSPDAVVLVYDVANSKSYDHLVAWLFELCTSVWPPSLRYWDTGGGSGGVPDVDLEGGDGRGLGQAIFSGRCPVLFVAHKCDLRPPHKGYGPPPTLPRPQPPGRPPLLDRLLGGGGELVPGAVRTAGDLQLAGRLCDFVQQGKHMDASSKGDNRSFDYVAWRDFVHRALEARQTLKRENSE